MNGYSAFLIGVALVILVVAVPVAIARWIFRVNAQIALLEKISKNLETLVSLEKMRKG